MYITDKKQNTIVRIQFHKIENSEYDPIVCSPQEIVPQSLLKCDAGWNQTEDKIGAHFLPEKVPKQEKKN